jgi:hypothetical protein
MLKSVNGSALLTQAQSSIYSAGNDSRDVDDAVTGRLLATTGWAVEIVHDTREGGRAAGRSRARGRSAQREKDISLHGTMANSMRLIRRWHLLAIDPGRVAETYDAKNAPDEKRTNKARHIVARETGINGGVSGSISDAHRAENAALLRLQSLCVYQPCLPREIEHESVGDRETREYTNEIPQKQIDGLHTKVIHDQFLCSGCSALLCCGLWLPGFSVSSAVCNDQIQHSLVNLLAAKVGPGAETERGNEFFIKLASVYLYLY